MTSFMRDTNKFICGVEGIGAEKMSSLPLDEFIDIETILSMSKTELLAYLIKFHQHNALPIDSHSQVISTSIYNVYSIPNDSGAFNFNTLSLIGTAKQLRNIELLSILLGARYSINAFVGTITIIRNNITQRIKITNAEFQDLYRICIVMSPEHMDHTRPSFSPDAMGPHGWSGIDMSLHLEPRDSNRTPFLHRLQAIERSHAQLMQMISIYNSRLYNLEQFVANNLERKVF